MADTDIKDASNGRRAGAFLIDLGFSILLGFLIFTVLGYGVILKQGHYFENVSKVYGMLEEASLADVTWSDDDSKMATDISYHVPSKDGHYNAVNSDGTFGYAYYENDLKSFFAFLRKSESLGYKIADCEKYTVAYFNTEWLGLSINPDEDGYYGNAYYEPDINKNGEKDLSFWPVLRSEIKEALKKEVTKESTAKALISMYYDGTDSEKLYVKAFNIIVNSESYQTAANEANRVSFLATIPTFLAPSLTLFMLVPLLSKDGKTLGKRLLKIGLISKDGSGAKKWQIALHYLPFVLMGASFLIPGYSSTVLMIIFLLLTVDLMLTAMHPKHQAIEDRIARTLVVDKTIYNGFASPADEGTQDGKKPSMDNVVEVEAKEKDKEDGEVDN